MPRLAEQVTSLSYPLDVNVPMDELSGGFDCSPAEVGRIALVRTAPAEPSLSSLPEFSTVPVRLMQVQALIGALQDERRNTPLSRRHWLDTQIAPLKEDEAKLLIDYIQLAEYRRPKR